MTQTKRPTKDFRETNIRNAELFLRKSAGDNFRKDLTDAQVRKKAIELCEVFPEPFSRKLKF